MDTSRRTFMHAIAAGLFARPCNRWPFWKDHGDSMSATRPADELLALQQAGTWINSPPLAGTALQGKVVLVQFWTYTCINWLRTLPYIRAWSDQYRDAGLVTVGVHTPEFGFERDLANVQRATPALDVKYPVAVDSDYRVWRAFNNHYWPALYLFDGRGRLQYRHFGEGEYDQTEAMVRVLLSAAGGSPGEKTTPDQRHGVEAAPDWSNLRSPENYLGYGRTSGFASAEEMAPGKRQHYTTTARLRLNQWALEGDWTIEQEAIRVAQAPGRIVSRFHARDLHLVMGPGKEGTSIRFRVTIDGQAPGAAHGIDIDEGGAGMLTEQRLYQLLRQPGPIGDRTFVIEFLDPGAEAFAFTFG
jgi:thiol-disulfide isomerase/thioredoxin